MDEFCISMNSYFSDLLKLNFSTTVDTWTVKGDTRQQISLPFEKGENERGREGAHPPFKHIPLYLLASSVMFYCNANFKV